MPHLCVCVVVTGNVCIPQARQPIARMDACSKWDPKGVGGLSGVVRHAIVCAGSSERLQQHDPTPGSEWQATSARPNICHV